VIYYSRDWELINKWLVIFSVWWAGLGTILVYNGSQFWIFPMFAAGGLMVVALRICDIAQREYEWGMKRLGLSTHLIFEKED